MPKNTGRLRKLRNSPRVMAAATGLLAGALAAIGDNFGAAALFALGAALLAYHAVSLSKLRHWWIRHRSALELLGDFAISAASAPWFDREISPQIPLPIMSSWSLDPAASGLLVRWIKLQRPAVVLEIGSGISTLLMAYALERNGSGKIYSIDAEPAYASRTMALLKAHGLSHRADVIVAPLEPLALTGWEGDWYRTDVFELIDDAAVELLVVDGPPKGTAQCARYPALPVIQAKLKPDATIALDDADRADEEMILQMWVDEGFLNEHLDVFPFGSGFAVGTASSTR